MVALTTWTQIAYDPMAERLALGLRMMAGYRGRFTRSWAAVGLLQGIASSDTAMT